MMSCLYMILIQHISPRLEQLPSHFIVLYKVLIKCITCLNIVEKKE